MSRLTNQGNINKDLYKHSIQRSAALWDRSDVDFGKFSAPRHYTAIPVRPYPLSPISVYLSNRSTTMRWNPSVLSPKSRLRLCCCCQNYGSCSLRLRCPKRQLLQSLAFMQLRREKENWKSHISQHIHTYSFRRQIREHRVTYSHRRTGRSHEVGWKIFVTHLVSGSKRNILFSLELSPEADS